MLLNEMYGIFGHAKKGTDPFRIVKDLEDLTGRLIQNELSESSVYVTVLAIQSIIDHICVTDPNFSSNGRFNNTIVWIGNSKKFITKYIDHFDSYAKNHIINHFDHISLMIQTLNCPEHVIYHLPKEEDLKDMKSCPRKLKVKIELLMGGEELDRIVRKKTCSICSKSVNLNSYVLLDSCNHYFCRTCIEPWFRNR